jgi:hypothetical protein
MVKCLECGFESSRLQWTHFRFNCTGKFKNGTEYKKYYPNAEIIDKDLAKKTAITLENLVKKYGDVEGSIRWKTYKDKQALSNSLEYKKEKHGWSEKQFKEYNDSRSQTLKKMIERHGEAEGIIKWEKYCDRQSYTNTKSYFIQKYGEDLGTKKYIEINKKKSVGNPVILAEKLNISIHEAVDIIIYRQKNIFKSNLEKEFIQLIEERIGPLEHTSFKNPYGKWSKDLDTYVIYDVKHGNNIIEFNGDYWHANPKVYNETAIIRGKKAIDIWQRDMLKLKTAQDLGFNTLTVWELDFNFNKIKKIEEVIEWLSKDLK